MDQLRAGVGAKQVVLVVDDDSAVRNSLRFTLEVEGFEVRAYSSAHELLDEDRLPTLSCLVTDYHMPAMNGLELVAQLRYDSGYSCYVSSQRQFAQPCRCGRDFNCREASPGQSFAGLHPQRF